MVDHRISNVVETVLSDINKSVEETDQDILSAEEIIPHLVGDGGTISVPSNDFTVKSASYEDVSYAEGLYEYAYGVDGSTTKSISFNNGLILSVSVAAAAASEKSPLPDVCEERSIWVVSYFEDEVIDTDVNASEDNISFNYIQLDDYTDIKRGDFTDWITSISLGGVEGYHFKHIAEDIDNPVFLDGPIFPIDIFRWIMYGQESYRGIKSPMGDWDDICYNIIQSYIDGIESCLLNNVPVFGIQKTTKSSRVIDDICRKSPDLESEIRWNSDSALMTSALSGETTDGIAYTPWYIQESYDDKMIKPFQSDNITFSYGDYSSYQRAHFFAKPFRSDTVYRIGVPRVFFDRVNTKEELRDIALVELHKQQSEPACIQMADDKINIPREMRYKFAEMISSNSQISRNEERGYN